MSPARAALLLAFLVPARAGAAGSVGLAACYERARARSGDLKARREDVEQSRARARAALGGAFPDVRWELTDTRQDPAGVEALEARGFSGFVEKDQVESKFSLKQPLFSGFREWSAWSGFRRESVRDALLLKRASLRLLADTADAFYEVLESEADRENTRSALSLAEARVKELTGFRRLGKARDSEVFTAQAHAAALRARLRAAEARIASARVELSHLTGDDLSSTPLADAPSLPEAGSLEAALSAVRGRSDLAAQREDAAAQALRVRYERGSFWPGVDVTGNYYTSRPAFMDQIDWDVVLSLRVPLFQGGSTAARVREASAARRRSEALLDEMEREASRDVRRLHGELAAAVEEARSLEEAAQAAEKSHDALLSEYRLGLVTNLEVLQATDFLLEQSSARDAARFKAKRLGVRLDAALEKPL